MGGYAGDRGIFVLRWAETEIDGVRGAAPGRLSVGAQWRWLGEALRIDGPAGLLVLGDMIGAGLGGAALRARAAQKVRRILGRGGIVAPGVPTAWRDAADVAGDAGGAGFTVTDGRRSYALGLTAVSGGGWLVLCTGAIPPAGTDLHVVACHCGEEAPGAAIDADHEARSGDRRRRIPAAGARLDAIDGASAGGVICFTPGTRIATPDGPRAIETIRPGDRISTRDDGAQQVLWTGARRMSGARLYALPHLRPVRIRAGAMGEARPEGDLIVSPQHRMLVKGAQAQALFSHDEVLVAAADLIDDRMVVTETALREVTYVHLMTGRHQIVWANGLETESFHPANACLDMIAPDQRAALLSAVPGLDADPGRYGGFARRNLSSAEAAILRHGAT